MQFVKKVSILISSLAVLGGCASGQTAFNKGQNYEQTGDMDQAIIKYAEAATANPEISEYRLRFLKACAESARIHFDKGEKFEEAENYGNALREYQTAYTLDPSLAIAKQHTDRLNNLVDSQNFYKEGEEFEKNGKTREALRSYRKALELDPDNEEAEESVSRISKATKSSVEGFELNLKSTKPITLKFKDAKLKEVFNIISKLSGINFIFDEAVKDVNFSIYLENGTFYQALDVITELNKLGKKVLNESNVIIYPKNPEKNKQYEELFLQTFYLNKIDAKKAINLLRTMMQIKKIYVNEEMNAIVIRDTPEVIALAGKILEANDIPDAEVVLEVEVIELSKKNAENLGFLLSRYAVSVQGFNNGTPFSDTLNTVNTSANIVTPTSPSNLLQLFQYNQFSGFLTVPNATFNFGKTLANGETLSNPRMRIKNKEKAKFNVGTRVPITTTSSPVGGGVSVNVQYVDVGVKMNAEPTIQLNNDISIKLSMEVSSILSRDTVGGAGSATTVVTIGTRNLDTVLSLKDGETSIIGGLIQDSKTNSKQKISFIGDIPIIGSFFSSHDDSNDKTELVLAITPRIVRNLAVPGPSVSAFWSGKEDDPSTTKNYTSFNKEDETVPSHAGVASSAQSPVAPVAPEKRAVSSGQLSVPPSQPSATPGAPSSVESGSRTRTVTAVDQPAAGTQVQPAPAVAAPVQVAPSAKIAPAIVPPVTPIKTSGPAADAEATGKAVLNVTAPQTVKVNDDFLVHVTVSDVTNMYAGVLALQYDPALMTLVSAAEGTFLKKDGKTTTFQYTYNKDKGRVNVNFTRIGAVGGVSGSGELAVISFKAKGKGSATLGLSDVHILPPTGSKPFKADTFSTVTTIQ